MRRRDFLTTGLAFGTGSIIAAPAWSITKNLEVIHGFNAQSTTGAFAGLVVSLLNRAQSVVENVDSFPGNHGWNAIEFMKRFNDQEKHLLVVDTLTMALYAQYNDAEAYVRSLTPIAKITNGISTCLIASKESGVTDWASFKNAAQARQFKIASTGIPSAYGVAVDWVSKAVAPMDEVFKLGNAHILESVENGTADVGVVSTNSLPLPMDSDFGNVVRICTFGAKRSDSFPQTPTFAELVGDTKKDYTIAFSVFAPADISEALAQELQRKLLAPATSDMLAPLGALARNVDPKSAEVVAETLERDFRVAASLAIQN